jgi:hypothetical protein
MDKQIIGRFDRVAFPELRLSRVKVKVDTGAFNSSMHVSEIKEDKEGLHFVPLEKGMKGYSGETLTFKNYDKRLVKSSNGESEERFLIKTNIRLFGEEIPLQLTLTDRSQMRFPILLGRSLLRNRFLVDVDRSYLSSKSQKTNNLNP